MTESKEQRMILAGRYQLEGLSLKQALIKAGYSEQTARCPAANGLSAKRCIELALKDGKETLPATLRASARELLQKKLDAAMDDPESVSLTSAARATEVVEKVYGHSEERIEPARTFAERLKWMQDVTAALNRRENLIDSAVDRAVTVDAVVIDAGPEDPGTPEN